MFLCDLEVVIIGFFEILSVLPNFELLQAILFACDSNRLQGVYFVDVVWSGQELVLISQNWFLYNFCTCLVAFVALLLGSLLLTTQFSACHLALAGFAML